MNNVKSEHSQKYKPPKKSPHFGQNLENTRKSGSPKTFNFTNASDTSNEICEKCRRRMRLEQKQTQNIPLTETEKKELNFVKMEMMIFDVRYEVLQDHGTLPN